MGAAVLVWTHARSQSESKTSSQAALTRECVCFWRWVPSVTLAELVQGRRGGRRHEHCGSGAKLAALTSIQCLDLSHFPMTHPAAAHEVASETHSMCSMLSLQAESGRKDIAGITTQEQGPWRTVVVSESSNTSTALLWGQSDHPQLPKLGPAPAQSPCPSSSPHVGGLPVNHPTAVLLDSSATDRLVPPPQWHNQEQLWPAVSSGCKAEMFTGSNFKLCP